MNWSNIISIGIIVICAVGYGFAMYFKVKGNVLGAVSELIAMAEKTGLTGEEKMGKVVGQLAERVPSVLKGVLNEETLKKIAQFIFDWMREYAIAYEEKKDLSEIKEVGIENIAEVVSGLMNLTKDKLIEKANEMGIEIGVDYTKEEIIKCIVRKILAA